jgi:hypothetical protein
MANGQEYWVRTGVLVSESRIFRQSIEDNKRNEAQTPDNPFILTQNFFCAK